VRWGGGVSRTSRKTLSGRRLIAPQEARTAVERSLPRPDADISFDVAQAGSDSVCQIAAFAALCLTDSSPKCFLIKLS